jgi:hypothetical protein
MGFPLGKEGETLPTEEDEEEEVVGLDFVADEQVVSLLVALAWMILICRMGIFQYLHVRSLPRYQRWESCIAKSRHSPKSRRDGKA